MERLLSNRISTAELACLRPTDIEKWQSKSVSSTSLRPRIPRSVKASLASSVESPSTRLSSTVKNFKAYTMKDLDELTSRAGYSSEERLAIRAVASVLPFRTNNYVIDELIDWSAAPNDPIFRLVFPHEDMLPANDVAHIADLLRRDASKLEVQAAAHSVRMRLNPHPDGQLLNIPSVGPDPFEGIQHKYDCSVCIFPKEGQECHSYCTYCFRWAQFVGEPELKMATAEIERFREYVKTRPNITDVIFTGGDPMFMSASLLRRYLEPIAQLDSVETIRIGTKSLAYWPQKYVTDPDADDTLRLFERIAQAGKSLAFQAHFSHPRELETPMVREAVRRIRNTGATIRTQAPLIRTINDDPSTWSAMWRDQVRLGMIPYYMFVERDTGPCDYFSMPLEKAYEIYTTAYRSVSGLARTVRGPSMSASAGKVIVNGIVEISGEKVFALNFIRSRDPQLENQPFFAKYDPKAVWLSDLKPAFIDEFPFELE